MAKLINLSIAASKTRDETIASLTAAEKLITDPMFEVKANKSDVFKTIFDLLIYSLVNESKNALVKIKIKNLEKIRYSEAMEALELIRVGNSLTEDEEPGKILNYYIDQLKNKLTRIQDQKYRRNQYYWELIGSILTFIFITLPKTIWKRLINWLNKL